MNCQNSPQTPCNFSVVPSSWQMTPLASTTTVDNCCGITRKNHKENSKMPQLNSKKNKTKKLCPFPDKTEYPIFSTSLSHLLLSSTLNHPVLPRSLPCEEVDLRVCLPLLLWWPKMGISFTAQSFYWLRNKEGWKERLRAKSKISNRLKFFSDCSPQ